MVSTKIYYNGACGTCCNTLALMEDAGHEPEIIEYLKTPPSKEELSNLLDQMGLEPMDAMRKKGQVYESLDLEGKSREELIDLMTKNPVLIERPIVVTDKGTKICRPADEVKEIL